jgi:high-affinity iron transporter
MFAGAVLGVLVIPADVLARSALLAWLLLCSATMTCAAGAAQSSDATIPVQQLLQTAAYIGVDYRGAVSNGAVADPNEYAEMVEFATTLARGVTALPDSTESAALAKDAQSLVDAVARKSDAAQIRVITARMQAQPVQGYPVPVLPAQDRT